MSIDRLGFLTAYLRTRRAIAQLRTRADIERRQEKLWRAFYPVIAKTPALSHLSGKPVSAFPIRRPADIREDFKRWNILDLASEAAHAAAADAENGGSGEVAPGITAGFSTGTSGAPGVFLASKAERASYLGQALAKLLPWDALLRPRRIMLCLRADSDLYRDVRNAGPFQFHFVKLGTPPRDLHGELSAFKPHVLIAPSHVLAGLAQLGHRLSGVDKLFYGAEPMGDDERDWIRDRLGVRPDPIYQATEGFLGAACRHGALHLNEDSLLIERATVAGTNCFQPIITDLLRTTQPMVRIQIDDLLEPVALPCPCGSPLLAVLGVEGRVGDLWRWNTAVITPREVSTTIARAVGADAEWTATANRSGITISIAEMRAPAALAAVTDLLHRHGVACPVLTVPPHLIEDVKRRRVRWLDA